MLLPTPPLVAPRRPPSYGGSGLRQGQVIHPPQVSPESDLNSPPQGLRVLTDPARYQYLQTPRPQAWPGPPRVRRQVPTRTPLPPPRQAPAPPPPARPSPGPSALGHLRCRGPLPASYLGNPLRYGSAARHGSVFVPAKGPGPLPQQEPLRPPPQR